MGKIKVNIGDKSGYLTVEGVSYVHDKSGRKWRKVVCRCQCGGTTETTAHKFYTGWSRSCGCISMQLRKQTILNKYMAQTRVLSDADKLKLESYGPQRMEYLVAATDFWVTEGMSESLFSKKKTEMFMNTEKFLKY